MRWVLVPWKVKEEAFWRNYFAHIYAVREAILGSRIEKEAAERAASSEMTGKRNLDDLLLFATDESDGIASTSFEKSGGATGEDVIELSSLSMEGPVVGRTDQCSSQRRIVKQEKKREKK